MATVVCLVLLALLAVVQIAHAHPLESDADHCPLCVVLHSAAPVVVTPAIIVVVPLGVAEPVIEPREICRSWHPKLFTRPPPSAC